MIAPRRLSQLWLWPLLALGAAGSGGACSAPAPPPEQAAPDAPAQEPAGDTTQAAPTAPAADPGDAEPAAEPDRATSAESPVQRTPESARPPVVRPPPPAPGEAEADGPATLTVTMLSRGKGVPDETRAAYQDARALLERQRDAGIVTAMRAQRIGLEGETRLCAEFRSEEDARAALAEIRTRSGGIDLLDARLAPCPSPKGKSP